MFSNSPARLQPAQTVIDGVEHRLVAHHAAADGVEAHLQELLAERPEDYRLPDRVSFDTGGGWRQLLPFRVSCSASPDLRRARGAAGGERTARSG